MRLLGRWTAAALAFCLFSAAADAGGPYVSRSTMFAIEKKLEAAVRGRWHDDPYMFVDLPRGYYVDNFGVIFVTEFSLAPGPGLSPFRGPISRQEIKQHKTTVLARVPELKDTMKAQLLEVAAALPARAGNGKGGNCGDGVPFRLGRYRGHSVANYRAGRLRNNCYRLEPIEHYAIR